MTFERTFFPLFFTLHIDGMFLKCHDVQCSIFNVHCSTTFTTIERNCRIELKCRRITSNIINGGGHKMSICQRFQSNRRESTIKKKKKKNELFADIHKWYGSCQMGKKEEDEEKIEQRKWKQVDRF